MNTNMSGEKLTQEHLEKLNAALAQCTLEEVLTWCFAALPTLSKGALVQVTSFGSTGMCILHAMSKLGLKTPVVFLDTLYHFQETLDHARRVSEKYKLDMRMYRNLEASTRAEFETLYKSTNMWISDPHRFEQLTKVGPLERALNELNVGAWITGRRADQGGLRQNMQILEMDPSDGRIKVNPLANWNRDRIWSYLRNEGIPYNRLYDQSYTSIGDTVTTTKNEDASQGERAGRFYQFEGTKTECGIHNRKRRAATFETSAEKEKAIMLCCSS